MVITLWMTLVIGVVLLLLILAQGRFYWKTEICRLALAGDRLEVMTSRWVGGGKTFIITPSEATNWRSVERSAEDKRVPNIKLTIKGQDYDMSMTNPTTVDPVGLREVAPQFFGQLEARFPALKSDAA